MLPSLADTGLPPTPSTHHVSGKIGGIPVWSDRLTDVTWAGTFSTPTTGFAGPAYIEILSPRQGSTWIEDPIQLTDAQSRLFSYVIECDQESIDNMSNHRLVTCTSALRGLPFTSDHSGDDHQSQMLLIRASAADLLDFSSF